MSAINTLQLAQVRPFIDHIKQRSPLIHCITNDVVQNFTANVLLAIGASPAMVIAEQEVATFAQIASGLLINVGTIHSSSAQSMLLAAASAQQNQTPWVLDPVAIGPALAYRSEIVQQLLAFKPTVVRGNASEILALNGETTSAKGPDGQDSTESALNAAKKQALKHQTIIAITGDIDYITNGTETYSIKGGDITLTKITGTGCSLSAMVAAFIAGSTNPLLAAASACFMMKKAGELANKHQGLGTYSVSLLDKLSLFNSLYV
ncbi:hydroxyethylthiazole kinase [Gilliamella sp. B2776]|uniref:hydroxyethylthiazole kinase n=1 Tax=unclassified Gilliamella TaxID=2685620 RepID=UPI00226AB2A1|nr:MULTISPECIES: hydroxyethylthiazole kinase [unclassified Gilliamella]MCX8649299.1 hydroxyethylthiazole kinase [Gilliamella sp. B2779]MCX8655087.1 hydroxyethylthiazole kinase [Gilliamella sp. B2737]MCX8691206.1 hydroxyethylthiazole kinase [Gilliamella sp. B2776]MCX8699641.1 hydroxyethylthiazole kinase [Gilliamella sp. B2840]MCX8702269.1 hydroxyethylthiazole kinase [Gilliamella sp. B2781]